MNSNYNKKNAKLENIVYAQSNLMSDEEKDRAHTFCRTALAILLSVLPVLGLSCRNYAKVKEPTSIVAQSYTIQDLKAALGVARWRSLNNEQKNRFINGWEETEENSKKLIIDVYSNPKKIYREFSEDEKKRFNAFKVSDLDEERVNEYKKAFPWINPEQPALPDKEFIYWIEKIGYLANLK